MSFSNEISELVYQDYLCIEPKDFQERIRFFDHNRKDIDQLPYEMRLEMSIEYTVALFEVGDYFAFLKRVDQLLALSIHDNLFSIDGDDIYQELLFRKACSLHNIVDYHGADHVFSELIRIDVNNKTYKQSYYKNKVSQLRYLGQKVRTTIILLLMLTGIMIGIELLIVLPFFPEYSGKMEWIRNGLFISAVGGILLQELTIRFRAVKNIKKLSNKA